MEQKIIYKSEPTGKKFHRSPAFIRGVMGCVRSGKSTMMTNEALRLMKLQPAIAGPWSRSMGKRSRLKRSRFMAARNTYRELEDTTLKTWLDWWKPDIFGKFNYGRMMQNLSFEDIQCEVLFRAIERPADVSKLLSLELSWAWANEAREFPKLVIDTISDRVGQFPSPREGGCNFPCVMMDTNPPDDDHWWYALAENDEEVAASLNMSIAGVSDRWSFFKQPGAVIEVDGQFIPNPAAENINNLNEGYDYYLKRIPGKSKDYVRVYYAGQYGFVVDGKPVHSDYHDVVHCSNEIIPFNKRFVLYVGLDFGLTPAATFGQRYPNGRRVCIDELVTEDMGAERFATELKRKLSAAPYDKAEEIEIWGDPAGDERAQTDEHTVYDILAANGIYASPCHTNDPTIRRESLGRLLRSMIDGKPAFMISPNCKITRKGLNGGFCYKRIQVAGAARYQDKPEKNRFSHPVESLEYQLVGSGEGRSLVTPSNPRPRPAMADTSWDDGF
jgi:hypothetical protein